MFPPLLMSNYYQVQETDEARKKFSNAKSISSAQFFGDHNKAHDMDSQVALQKFSVRALEIASHLVNILFCSFFFFPIKNPSQGLERR